MAVDVASMSVEELEAVWLRRAGMRSDLSVDYTGGDCTRSDCRPASVMEWISRSSPLDVPASPLVPSHLPCYALLHRPYAPPKVASFCYGMDFKISPLDAPALACAARSLLLSFAAAAMAGMLKHADAALAGAEKVSGGGEGMGPVPGCWQKQMHWESWDEAADRLADHAVTSHKPLHHTHSHLRRAGGLSPMHPWTICSCFIRSSSCLTNPTWPAISPLSPLPLPQPSRSALHRCIPDDLLMLETSDVQVWSGGGGLGSGAEGLNAF
ncbi:unnamed protein product, partial [Closterium sp. Naga37s-1]